MRKIALFCGRARASNVAGMEFRIEEARTALGRKEMKSASRAVLLLLAMVAASGVAQQSTTFKVKHSSTTEKAPPKAHATLAKTKGPETASAANSKDLQSIEHEKVASPARSGANKTPALKPVKDKPNPPINFSGTGGTKTAGMTRQNANPYAGRLKQKYSHQ
jgi:hypothetical protein